MRQQRVGDRHRVARHEVDDAGRQARGLEQLHHVVAAQHRRLRRLPDHGVAHQRRRAGQVAADGREVERAHGVDEALERAVVGLVPDALLADRLLAVEVLGVGAVEAEEVDQLARRVDLGLVRRLALPEHRRGVERVAPRRREQFGGPQEHRGAVFPGPAAPFLARGGGGGDGLLHQLGRRLVPGAEHVRVVVRHHDGRGVAGAVLLAVDDDGDVDVLAGHAGEARLQRGALGRARGVAADRLVDDGGYPATCPETGDGESDIG